MGKILTAVLTLVFLSFPALAATLQVGADREFKTLRAAVGTSSAGDTIILSPGDYVDDFAIIRHPLTIRSDGGKARLLATDSIPNGKAILIANADLTVQNLIFEGAKVLDRNGAGIRYQRGNLKVEHCIFKGNENGILGSDDLFGLITISNSVFRDNGYGDGYTHSIYVGNITGLTIYRTGFIGTRIGHHIKSRAAITFVDHNYFADGDDGSSYAIDLPNGGTTGISNNYLIQGASAQNSIIISYGTKDLHPVGSVSITDNIFINLAKTGTAFRNRSSKGARFANNQLIGSLRKTRGHAEEENNIELGTNTRQLLTYDEWKKTLPDEEKEYAP